MGAATVGVVLAEMRIQGLGVIEDALLELHPGFTVVTGETGAGKTMVVTGLHLLSGGRAEASKVTWPTRRETMITTVMVFIMVAVSSIFFLAADQIIRIVVTFILGIKA